MVELGKWESKHEFQLIIQPENQPLKTEKLVIFILHMIPDLKHSWPSLLCTYSSLQSGGLMLILEYTKLIANNFFKGNL